MMAVGLGKDIVYYDKGSSLEHITLTFDYCSLLLHLEDRGDMKYHKQPTWESCMRTCLACILDLELDEVPEFLNDGTWFDDMAEWLDQFGMTATYTKEMYTPCKDTYYLAMGKSMTNPGWTHAVIFKNMEMLHDPSPSNKGLDGEPQEFIFFVVKEPWKHIKR